MTTWIDPTFDEAITKAGLIAIGRVIDADPRGGRVEILRVLAGQARPGDNVTVRRAEIVGRGHENNAMPRDETFAFVVRGENGTYEAFTDSYWTFAITDGGERVHLPVRDPFTRAYVPIDELAEIVACVRDRHRSPEAYLSRQCTKLAATPVAATQPIEVNDQIVALESLALLGSAAQADAPLPYLASPHFQVRWSAVRALGKCGGPRAARALLDLLAKEGAPPVQAALAEALSGLADASMRDELQAALPKMFDHSMTYSRNLMSPIMNMMPCPRDELAKVIEKVSHAPAKAPPKTQAIPAMQAMQAMSKPAPTAAQLRELVSTKGVLALCESTPQGARPLIDDGQLVVLTSRDVLPAFETACDALFAKYKLTLQPIDDGVGIFANFPDAVTSIRINPGAPSDETFSGASLADLRDMARSVAVTRVAENPAAYDGASFGRIMRDHRRFVVPLQPVSIPPGAREATALTSQIVDGRVLAYEILRHRRADGMHYAVVFSWQDCAEAFFEALGQRVPTMMLDGAALFRELKRNEETYGATSVVLDMEGPTKQSWLKIGAWRLVL